MRIKILVKKMMAKLFFDKRKKRRTTEYWWELRESAKQPGMPGYLKKQMYNNLMERYNAFIPMGVQFAGCPIMPHGVYGVFISSGAQIGHNCTIFHQVTIGSNTLRDSKHCGAPIIGNNVYIGCGAKIIGNVYIGDNARIGANCVVTMDVPANATVVLEKPRIIQKENNINTFTTYEKFNAGS